MNGNDKKDKIQLTGNKARLIGLLIITIITAAILSPWASSKPDGLERVAEDLGFDNLAEAVNKWAPIPDYEVFGIPWESLRIGLAGLAGIIIMAVVLWFLMRLLSGERSGSIERRQ